jgi:hypothetical protein
MLHGKSARRRRYKARNALLGVERLDSRMLLAVADVIPRDFPYSISGSFSGNTIRPWGSGGQQYTYRDSFSGSVSGNGVATYENNLSGTGQGTITGSGKGSDSCWQSYNFSLNAGSFVLDQSGNFTVAAGPGFAYTDIKERKTMPSAGCPSGAGAIPGALTGTWSPSDYIAKLAYSNNGTTVNFTGDVTQSMSGSTDIAIGKVLWSDDPETPQVDCVEIDIKVTGMFPKAGHTEAIGKAEAFWADGFGDTLGQIFSEDVYWNTGEVKVHSESLPARPVGASHILVKASISGDSNTDNNEKLVPLTPDLRIDSVEWGTGPTGGAKFTYSIVGGDLTKGPVQLGLFWSSDATWDSGDFAATSDGPLFSSNTKEGKYTIEIPGQSFFAPGESDLYLIAAIDVPSPNGKVVECDEDNNSQSVALTIPPLKVEFEVPEASIRNRDYSAVLTVTHGGPVPINVDISWDVTTNIPGATVPGTQVNSTLLIANGALPWDTKWSKTFRPNWEWIPKLNPIDLEGAFISSVRKNVLQELLKMTGPVGKFGSELTQLADYVVSLLTLFHNLDKGIRNGDFTHVLQVKPKVSPSLAGPVEIQKSVKSEVEPEKVALLAKCRLEEYAMKTAVGDLVGHFRDLALGKRAVSPAEIEASMGLILVSYTAARQDYDAAYDPPDPLFEAYLRPASTLPQDYSNIPEGSYRDWLASQGLLDSLTSTRNRTLDKLSGALEAENSFWIAEQQVVASDQSHRHALLTSKDVAIRNWLSPYFELNQSTSAEKTEYLRANGLSTQLKSRFLESGVSESSYAAFEREVLKFDSTDFEEFQSSDAPSIQIATSIQQSDIALSLLNDAISNRNLHLNMKPRNLSAEEETEIVNLRNSVTDLMDSNIVGISSFDTIEVYLSTARRLALETNNFTALEKDLNFGYTALFELQMASANLVQFKTRINEAKTNGGLTAVLAEKLLSNTESIRKQIAESKWSEAQESVSTLEKLIANANDSEIDARTRTSLGSYARDLKEASILKPAFEGVGLKSVETGITATLGQFPINWMKEAKLDLRPLGSLAGTKFDISVSENAESDDFLQFVSTESISLDDGTIVVDGRSAGRVVVQESRNWQVELYSTASKLDAERLLGAFHYGIGSTPLGQHEVKVQVRDVVGGLSEATTVFEVDMSNSPPASISITPNSALERISGLMIGNLSATDPDQGQTHVFSTTDERFEIVGNTLKLRSGVYLDRTNGGTVRVGVTATDSGDPMQSFTQDVEINLVDNRYPWQNKSLAVDVDGNGKVFPLDVLLILNELNAPKVRDPSFRLPVARVYDSKLPLFDVNGDGLCSPVDALIIINHLNANQGGGGGEGEGADDNLGQRQHGSDVVAYAGLANSEWWLDREDDLTPKKRLQLTARNLKFR